jgi:hypothetical protein
MGSQKFQKAFGHTELALRASFHQFDIGKYFYLFQCGKMLPILIYIKSAYFCTESKSASIGTVGLRIDFQTYLCIFLNFRGRRNNIMV